MHCSAFPCQVAPKPSIPQTLKYQAPTPQTTTFRTLKKLWDERKDIFFDCTLPGTLKTEGKGRFAGGSFAALCCIASLVICGLRLRSLEGYCKTMLKVTRRVISSFGCPLDLQASLMSEVEARDSCLSRVRICKLQVVEGQEQVASQAF